MSDSTPDRAALAADLRRARTDFHGLLDVAVEPDWNEPTERTRWTNEQLLFHMVFGYMVVRRLLLLARIFGRLPDGVSRRFAGALDAVERPFHMINYYGTCAAALVYNRHRMRAKMNREIDKLLRSLAGEKDSSLRRGMYYPTSWDPYFGRYMTLADIYRYPGQHYDHHRRQLTLTNM